ncbi:zinc finger CW-type PWWP domain protein 1-like [Watersipora subatra]|uniref:zinc finger CW-type PWWP domain protein 1-like n=1 Tax=Watersipora subatra TaxID=2589382 RepID=UPI00355B5C6C
MDKSSKGSFAASVTSGKNKTLAENNVRKMRSLTDKEYEELFDGILRQSLISEAMESDQAMSLSQKEYATLQPAIIYDELNTNLDCEVDFTASPKTNKKGVDFRQPNKKIYTASQNNAVKQPIWKSTKTISDVKSINKSNRKAEMNSVGKKACYSMDTSASKKAKGKNQKSKGITSRNGELVIERGKDCKGDCAEEEWSLTQECNKGVWIQCGEPDCGKWRHLVNMHDPSQFINIKWKCSDSEDTSRNTCESPMESWDQHANWTYNRFTEGSIVWAKLDGYPWWPGMIEVDPDMQAFVFCFEHSYYTPAEYHVTFFDTDKVTRAWVCKKSVKPFIASRIWEQMNGKSNNKRLQDAVNQAEESLNLSLVQRLRNYGFASRYEGRIVGHTSPSKSSLQTQCTSTAQKGAIEKPVKKTKSRKSTNLSEQTQETVAKKSTNHAARKKQQNKNTEDKGGKQKACTKNTNSVGSSNKESTRKSAKGKKISTLPVSGKLDELTCSALMPSTENPPAVNVSKATSLPADSQTTSRDSQQFVDMEKELDEHTSPRQYLRISIKPNHIALRLVFKMSVLRNQNKMMF